jgi:hypothetical protein
MFSNFLRFLDRIGRKRVIMDRQSKDPYLVRYYLFLKDRNKFPFNVFLHQFLRSDPDDLHDHPWPYATFIIKGGYWEWVPTYNEIHKVIDGEKKVWRGPGHFRISKAESFHRIEVEPGVDCWTIFMPGPQKREWGFLTHTKWKFSTFNWVYHEDYISVKSK